MKSKVKQEQEVQTYPVIMRSESGNIIMFSEAAKGTTLASELGTYKVGEYGENFEMSKFEVFHGEVTVSN